MLKVRSKNGQRLLELSADQQSGIAGQLLVGRRRERLERQVPFSDIAARGDVSLLVHRHDVGMCVRHIAASEQDCDPRHGVGAPQ